MNEDEKRATIDRYNARFAQFGHDPRTLGWPKRQHRLRYEILLSHWDLQNRSLCDFGCGFGDMYAFCQETGRGVRYHGIDINANLIEEGRRLYPRADLQAIDILQTGFPRSYDVIVASGVYNFGVTDSWGFVKHTFDLFRSAASRGFAVNFLSSHADRRDEKLFYADPCEALELCYKYSHRVAMRHDYMPFEFSVFVDLQETFDKEYTVFPEYLSYIRDAGVDRQ